VLKSLGARVFVRDGLLCAEAPTGLVGGDIHLPLRSTGATENALLCGALARGVTRIWNPHVRAEIIDLADVLNRMGARITIHGQEYIEVEGAAQLSGVTHTVMPDNMEALTWLIASVVTGGDIEIVNFPTAHLEVPLIFLRESGARFFQGPDSVIVRGGACFPVEISTGPYPGINSDMQPLFAAFGCMSRGESRIVDLRFQGRYGYADEFARMGVSVTVQDNMLRLRRNGPLRGAEVRALDLRAGVALTLLGLAAEGETVVTDAWQIERGYSRFVDKLRGLGGNIRCGAECLAAD
jgi:UDP-N-acetylglucosamine 1-carboxyvinyltransferase